MNKIAPPVLKVPVPGTFLADERPFCAGAFAQDAPETGARSVDKRYSLGGYG